jgi:hypothetical protein
MLYKVESYGSKTTITIYFGLVTITVAFPSLHRF